MKFVMFYETDLEKLPLARLYFPGHRARLEEFRARGTLLMAGPFANPADGAIGIFTEKEAAEEFIAGDPFVTNGVVKKFSVLQWNEVLAKKCWQLIELPTRCRNKARQLQSSIHPDIRLEPIRI